VLNLPLVVPVLDLLLAVAVQLLPVPTLFLGTLSLAVPPAPNPPFDCDRALARMLAPDRTWGREDISPTGEVTGVVQRTRRIGLGLVVEDVYPFAGAPFRRLNSTSAIDRSRRSLLSVIGGHGPIPK
jgi:hypothetical protein